MSKLDQVNYEIKNGIISNGVGSIGFLYVGSKGSIRMVIDPTRGQRRKRSK